MNIALQNWVSKMIAWELPVYHMYVDSETYVTIGIGKNLTQTLSKKPDDAKRKDTSDLKSLFNAYPGKFMRKRATRTNPAGGPAEKFDTNKKVEFEDVENEYLFLNKHAEELSKGKHCITPKHDGQRQFTTIELDQASVLDMYYKEVEARLGRLRALFTGFDHFPDVVQCSLLDFAFNTSFLSHGRWSHLKSAVRKRHWLTAASNANRKAIQHQERNKLAIENFKKAYQQARTPAHAPAAA